MKITILCENQTSLNGAETCSSEWGFSVLIEAKGKCILFDTGHSDIYWKNAEKLGIDLNLIDFVVLSHHHWDHIKWLLSHHFKDRKKLILHPDVMKKVSESISEKFSQDFDIIDSGHPLEIVPWVFFLGQIPRNNNFENGWYEQDDMIDDSAIAIQTSEWVVVISGCSHSGICNICEYSKEITGQKLSAVIGGFHLFEEDLSRINATISYFQTEKPKYLYPMHCVDFSTMIRFANECGVRGKYGAGDVIELID